MCSTSYSNGVTPSYSDCVTPSYSDGVTPSYSGLKGGHYRLTAVCLPTVILLAADLHNTCIRSLLLASLSMDRVKQ